MFRFLAGERCFFFVFVRKFKTSLGPTQNLTEGVQGGHSCGVKLLCREAEYTHRHLLSTLIIRGSIPLLHPVFYVLVFFLGGRASGVFVT